MFAPWQQGETPARYTLDQVLAIASKHPFYNDQQKFPLSWRDVQKELKAVGNTESNRSLHDFEVITKKHLIPIINRLCTDNDPDNTYKHAAYFSITGGGSGASAPMPIAIDARENRAQRQTVGEALNRLGLVQEGDLAISIHNCGYLYRSLDLMCEIIEYAGGSPLAAGNNMPFDRVFSACKQYRPNVLVGEPGQLTSFARWIYTQRESANGSGIRPEDDIRFDRIIYTSEKLTSSQEAILTSLFARDGQTMTYGSVYGGAEAGVWAVGSSALLKSPSPLYKDFIFDSRNIVVEILTDVKVETIENAAAYAEYREPGRLVLTSLQKLRQPLVRYEVGDLGSLHKLPDLARDRVDGDTDHLYVLRLHGRDTKESFEWQGGFFNLSELSTALEKPEMGILKWQLVLADLEGGCGDHTLEVRIMLDDSLGSDLHTLREYLKMVFHVWPVLDFLFEVKVVELNDFERSETGRKVIRVIDHRRDFTQPSNTLR